MTDPMHHLDTRTAIALGEALFTFLARTNDEAEADQFHWEDTGIVIENGFIEMPLELADTVQNLLDEQVNE